LCGKRLRRRSLLSVLFLLWLSVHCVSYSYADVTLTDEEAQQLMSEIQESRKDLTELQTQLADVKNDYEEQKTYYEEQLNEAKKKNSSLKTAVTATSASTAVFALLTVLLIFL